MQSKHTKLIRAMAVVTVLAGGFANQAMAIGTTAGTVINNKATLSFSSGGTPQTVIESSPVVGGNATPGVGSGVVTPFTVDRRINLSVATTNTVPTPVALGNSGMMTAFQVTNSTNDIIDVLLTNINNMPLASTGPVGTFADTEDFANGACTMHLDAAGATAAITKLTNLAADATTNVFIKCAIQPLTAYASPRNTYAYWNDKINVVSLVAQAAWSTVGAATPGVAFTQLVGADTAGVDNVFGDEAGGNGGVAGAAGTTNGGAGNATDAYRDGKHSANSAYIITMPILTVNKTETLICDPLNGVSSPKKIPGALIRYSITVTNDALAKASGILTQTLDPLQAELLHDVNFVTGTNAATCVAGGPATSVANSGFRVSNSAVSPATLAPNVPRAAGPVYMTNSAGDTDGASITLQNVTIVYTNAMPVDATHAAGEIKPGESVTIEFQAFVR
jgi:hypothetical protein